jgi:hypothetical protein
VPLFVFPGMFEIACAFAANNILGVRVPFVKHEVLAYYRMFNNPVGAYAANVTSVMRVPSCIRIPLCHGIGGISSLGTLRASPVRRMCRCAARLERMIAHTSLYRAAWVL